MYIYFYEIAEDDGDAEALAIANSGLTEGNIQKFHVRDKIQILIKICNAENYRKRTASSFNNVPMYVCPLVCLSNLIYRNHLKISVIIKSRVGYIMCLRPSVSLWKE